MRLYKKGCASYKYPKIITKLKVSNKVYFFLNKSFNYNFYFFFVAGSISNIDGAEYHCNKTQVRKVISGVVGAASSVTSIQVANLLRLFRIPQVNKSFLMTHLIDKNYIHDSVNQPVNFKLNYSNSLSMVI